MPDVLHEAAGTVTSEAVRDVTSCTTGKDLPLAARNKSPSEWPALHNKLDMWFLCGIYMPVSGR